MQTVTAKVLFIGILIVLLLIPQAMIKSTVRERESRQYEVKSEISEKWGREQVFSGPIISVPFMRKSIIAKAKDEEIQLVRDHFYLAPKTFTMKGDIKAEVRSRSIFDAILYTNKLQGAGNISFSKSEVKPKNATKVLWNEAELQISITDIQGLGNRPILKVGEIAVDFEVEREGMGAILIASLSGLEEELDFEFDLELKGSESFSFASSAENTKVDLVSNWETPSFFGANLPTTHDLKTAHWDIQNFEKPQAMKVETPSFNNMEFEGYPRRIRVKPGTIGGGINAVSGVKYLFPVDFYQKNERAIKYAVLFIILTFVAFFLIEILQKYRLHPIQYLLIGFAMVLFYALLLSFSEHMAFGKAYLIAAAANIMLISGYAFAIFKNKLSAGIILGLLSGIYVYLYFLLKSQDYALLSGTIFLFIVLAVIMFLTRNIDWYAVNTGKK